MKEGHVILGKQCLHVLSKSIKLLVAEAACAASAYLSSVLLLEQLKLLKLRVEHTS